MPRLSHTARSTASFSGSRTGHVKWGTGDACGAGGLDGDVGSVASGDAGPAATVGLAAEMAAPGEATVAAGGMIRLEMARGVSGLDDNAESVSSGNAGPAATVGLAAETAVPGEAMIGATEASGQMNDCVL